MPDSQLRILLVEDNDGDADLVQEYVDEVGQGAFVIRRGKTLAEGQAVLTSGYDPEVILLDLNLPDSKGLGTLDAFCALGIPGHRMPPIVVLTSLDDEDTVAKALAGCAQDYLVKQDISSKALVRAIRNAVQRQGKQAVEELAAEPSPDPAEAIQVIHRVNRTGPGALGDRPPEGGTAVDMLIEHQATALRAGEVLFGQQESRVRQLEIRQERIAADLDRANDKIEPLLKIAQGNGHGPLASRLDSLERALGRREEQQRTEYGFRRQVILGIVMLVLGGLGSLFVSLVVRGSGPRSHDTEVAMSLIRSLRPSWPADGPTRRPTTTRSARPTGC